MKLNSKMNSVAAAVAFAIGISTSAMAQETSSSIRGVVTTEAGQAVSNATVTLIDQRTGTSKVLSSNDSGTYSTRGLAVGGPYTVVVEGPQGRTRTIEDVYLTLGDTQSVNVTLQDAASSVERIQVTGQVISNANYGGTGPAANFGLKELQNTPAINRDLRDVVRVDPRIYINETNAGDIQCAGANPRFNSLTVDGVRTNDNFGLNSSGYPTERMPFSYDAIEQVAVELAPFDVQYGGFTACNINAVTKSGANELFGSVFFDYTNDSLQGDKLEGEDINVGKFNEKRYGFNGGGAILKDKLFWFAAYEKLEGAQTFDRGPAGTGAATEVQGITQAQADEIARIARDVYGFEPGSFPSSMPVEDEKFLAKLDWYINDNHRAAFTYNYNDGYSIAESDGDDDELEFSNHFYNRGAKFNSYVANLFSDWTSNFSTEVRVGYSKLENDVSPLGGNNIGEMRIFMADGPTVYLGADDSRHANKLKYDTTFFKLAGNYLYGDHSFSFGVEREEYDVFNLFVQRSQGQYDFDSIADFEAGIPSQVGYQNAAGTNNVNDGAASFKYAVNTAYAQDEYYFVDYDLTLTFGLRYDWYTTSSEPVLNQGFVDTYGFANNATVDGEGLLQPRLGFNWMATPQLEVRGGIGLYSGGNPNVWLSNNYSNNGSTLFSSALSDFGPGRTLFDIPFNGSGQPILDIPQELYDAVAEANGEGNINALDPNFELPKEWKYALGATYSFDSGYVVMADLLYTKKENAAIVKDLRRTEAGGYAAIGELADGRPWYPDIPYGTVPEMYMLTNVDGDSGSQLTASLSVSKSYDFGLDVVAAYAYTDAEDVNPMTSSVAGSNYTNFATADFENPGISTSNYEIPHRFTLRATYTTQFFDGYDSTFSLVGSANKGRPYSYTFGGYTNGNVGRGRQLLYVPTGIDDPNVVFADGFDTDAFFAFVEGSGLGKYAGEIAPRNEFYSQWWHKLDFRFEQELPGFSPEHRSSVFFVIDNLTNLLNDDWGVLYEASYPRAVDVVNAEILDDGRYQFNSMTSRANAVQGRAGEPSLWSVRVGFKYDF